MDVDTETDAVATRAPGPSPAELSTVLDLVRGHRAGLVNVGHAQDEHSRACAAAFLRAWPGEVGAVVSWPATAASWLRPACRLAAGGPDVWVVAACATSWPGCGRRLAATGWRARRTVAFAGLGDRTLPALAGFEATDGLTGAGPDGAVWGFMDGELIRLPGGERSWTR